MLVQRVVMPASSLESWTVLGDDDLPVGPVERYLAYLTDIERSPNTVKAYAHDLKDWLPSYGSAAWTGARCDWRTSASSWPGSGCRRLAGTGGSRFCRRWNVSAATVNRKLSALRAFYLHAARNGVDLGELLVTWGPAGGGGWKPFLHHISKGQPFAGARSR